MNDSESENTTLLSDRQLLEQIFNRLNTLEQNINARFEAMNERLLSLEVQTETLTSLAYQALSVAHAVKGDVRAL